MDRYQRRLLALTRAYRVLGEEISAALARYHRHGGMQNKRAAADLKKQQAKVDKKMVKVNQKITARRLKGKST